MILKFLANSHAGGRGRGGRVGKGGRGSGKVGQKKEVSGADLDKEMDTCETI